MALLEELIHPLTLQEFSEQYLFKAPYAAHFKAQAMKELISWPLLWEIFQTEHADCWLPKKGQLPPEPSLQTGKLSFDQARKGYEEGRTILVRHAEKAHPKLAAIAEDFHQLFQDPVDIQLYCTPPEEEGFDWHYDSEEVFVIQSGGEKEFRIRKNTVNPWPQHMRMPKNLQFEKEGPSPEIRCHLKAGDWLYIPSGWWHKARALTPSFHLSVGVMALTGAGYFEALLSQLLEDPRWQQRLPMRRFAHSASSQEFFKSLSQHLATLLQDSNRFKEFSSKNPPKSVNSQIHF
ncbi:MAG: cupin domain-containing protein [Pseudobdellovibrionaceae bacterium]